MLSIVLDQIKSVLCLYVVYVVVVRRFYHLSVNEHEYVKADMMSLPV